MRSRNEMSMFLAIPVVVVALLALAATPVLAKGLREFAGFYRILQATNLGNTVEVRISLRVFNYSEADVQNATILLTSCLPHAPWAGEAWEKEQPSFQGVALRAKEHRAVAPLEATFTVPALEYALWLKGAQPHFVIYYQDASGEPHHREIELMRRP
jgi:hypothetical protein